MVLRGRQRGRTVHNNMGRMVHQARARLSVAVIVLRVACAPPFSVDTYVRVPGSCCSQHHGRVGDVDLLTDQHPLFGPRSPLPFHRRAFSLSVYIHSLILDPQHGQGGDGPAALSNARRHGARDSKQTVPPGNRHVGALRRQPQTWHEAAGIKPPCARITPYNNRTSVKQGINEHDLNYPGYRPGSVASNFLFNHRFQGWFPHAIHESLFFATTVSPTADTTEKISRIDQERRKSASCCTSARLPACPRPHWDIHSMYFIIPIYLSYLGPVHI